MSLEGTIQSLFARYEGITQHLQVLTYETILNRCDLYLVKIQIIKSTEGLEEPTNDEKILRQLQQITEDYLFEKGEHNIRELHDAVTALESKPMRNMLKKLVDRL